MVVMEIIQSCTQARTALRYMLQLSHRRCKYSNFSLPVPKYQYQEVFLDGFVQQRFHCMSADTTKNYLLAVYEINLHTKE